MLLQYNFLMNGIQLYSLALHSSALVHRERLIHSSVLLFRDDDVYANLYHVTLFSNVFIIPLWSFRERTCSLPLNSISRQLLFGVFSINACRISLLGYLSGSYPQMLYLLSFCLGQWEMHVEFIWGNLYISLAWYLLRRSAGYSSRNVSKPQFLGPLNCLIGRNPSFCLL